MAMLALAHDWARVMGIGLEIATVDHGLRPASADEARMVAAECAALGHRHTTLHWTWDGTGNVQDAARAARLELFGAWRGDLQHVLFAHTKDDVAETFLMRLARGSGVEGLSAMSDKRRVSGFWQIRPLLGVTRADLRHHVETLKVPYADDPSNSDPRFERVRARRALAVLDDLGITRDDLAGTAERMARARDALVRRAASVAEDVLRPEVLPTGHVVFDRDAFASVERDTQMRLLAAALQYVSNASYRPRAAALESVLDRALAGGGATLHGAQVLVAHESIRILREFQAVKDITLPATPGMVWDGTAQVEAAIQPGLTIAALGEGGWAQLPEKSMGTVGYAAALSLPALFDGPDLVACPGLGLGSSRFLSDPRPAGSFIAFLQLR